VGEFEGSVEQRRYGPMDRTGFEDTAFSSDEEGKCIAKKSVSIKDPLV